MADKTIGTYQTKGFKHEGVTGSEPADRMSENGAKGITTQVMKENNAGAVQKVAKDSVAVRPTGSGMAGDAGKVKK